MADDSRIRGRPTELVILHLSGGQHDAGRLRAGRQRQALEGGQRPGAAGELHLRAAADGAARQLRRQDAVVAAALLPAIMGMGGCSCRLSPGQLLLVHCPRAAQCCHKLHMRVQVRRIAEGA